MAKQLSSDLITEGVSKGARETFSSMPQEWGLMHSLLDCLPFLVWRSDTQARCSYFNRTWLEFTGRDLEQELGDGWSQGVYPNDLEECLQSYLRAFHARLAFRLEYRLRRHDGEYRWVVDHGTPFYDAEKQFVGYIGACYDITERKQAETALLQSEARFQAFMDHSPALVIIKDAEGRYVYFNKAIERLVHTPLDELLGKTNFDRLPFETARQLHENDLEVLASGQAKEFIEAVPAPNGDTNYCLVSKFPLYDAAGQMMVGIVAFDITERKRIEAELRKSQTLLAEAEHLAHLGSWEWDVAANTLTWSDGTYHLCGFPRDYKPNYEAFIAHVHPEDREAVREHVQTTLSQHTPYRLYHRFIRPDGVTRVFYAQGAVTVDESGRATRMIGTTQDVTEQKQAEEERARLFQQVRAGRERLQALSRQLVEVQESERRTLARELHDEIGQSLTGLKLILEMSLNQPTTAPTRLREALAIVNDLMAQTREMSLKLRPTMLDDLGLLPTLLWFFERYESQTQLRVEFRHHGVEQRLASPIETAAYRIVQEALTNVARHANVALVRVSLIASDEKLTLVVEDQGVGFAPQSLSATSGGLAGMRERALLLGGQLSIQSTPGVGTRIVADLPVVLSANRSQQFRA